MKDNQIIVIKLLIITFILAIGIIFSIIDVSIVMMRGCHSHCSITFDWINGIWQIIESGVG